jgi:hypothetical protein
MIQGVAWLDGREAARAAKADRSFRKGFLMTGEMLAHVPPASPFAQAREYMRSLLDRLRRQAVSTAPGMMVDALCAGLAAIPVPVLNTFLSAAVRRMLDPEQGGSETNIDDVLTVLGQMQESDAEFGQGLETLGGNINEIRKDVGELMKMMQAQMESDRVQLRILNPMAEIEWPVFDNRVSLLMANVGGGSVVVGEIFLDVERWEPERAVDYTVAAAPLPMLVLRAELDTGRTQYPLLQLNHEPERVYDERGAGAERIRVDLSSAQNARYWIRLRAPFTDLSSGDEGTLSWPPLSEDPLTLPFKCAPGWHGPPVDKLLDPDFIYHDIDVKLSELLQILRRTSPGQEVDSEQLHTLGIPSVPDGMFLNTFLPYYAELAVTRNPMRALALMVGILTFAPSEGEEPGSYVLELLRMLAGNTTVEDRVTRFASSLGDPDQRRRLGGELLDILPSPLRAGAACSIARRRPFQPMAPRPGGGGPLVVVRDGLNTHVSRAMADLVAARDWLTIFRLPQYRPGLRGGFLAATRPGLAPFCNLRD